MSNAQIKSFAAEFRIKYARLVEELEQKFNATKTKLKELGGASDDAWEQLKDGVEASWHTLSTAIRNAASKFKN